MKQTYRSTSLRCTDFVPPHMGMVKVGGEDSAMGPFRRLRDERERERESARALVLQRTVVVVAVAVAIGTGRTEVRVVCECPNDGWG